MFQNNSHAYDNCLKLKEHIFSKTIKRPEIGVICGSGLGSLADEVKNKHTIPYSEIEGFPQSTVHGHAGNLIFGEIGSKHVVLMQGRFHPYEGYTTQICTIPIRVMHLMGVKVVILTNAAGGLNPAFKVGDMMIIKDHINLPGCVGLNPLVGPNDAKFGERFVPLNDAYDGQLRKIAKEIVKKHGEADRTHEGVYGMQFGPAFETVAECRMLRMFGADSVGMSTTHEVITARHAGMRVFGMSLITNKCVLDYDSTDAPNHKEVLEVGKSRAGVMQKIILDLITKISV